MSLAKLKVVMSGAVAITALGILGLVMALRPEMIPVIIEAYVLVFAVAIAAFTLSRQQLQRLLGYVVRSAAKGIRG